MKIALINENSQAAKNAMIEKALRKVVEPMGHEVFNYGMYTAETMPSSPTCRTASSRPRFSTAARRTTL